MLVSDKKGEKIRMVSVRIAVCLLNLLCARACVCSCANLELREREANYLRKHERVDRDQRPHTCADQVDGRTLLHDASSGNQPTYCQATTPYSFLLPVQSEGEVRDEEQLDLVESAHSKGGG